MFILLSLSVGSAFADSGYWRITQLAITNGMEPVINNSGEVVWKDETSGNIVSTVRGKLADYGDDPHLANSGEVVYADWFGGPGSDLVSTIQGRLTHGGIIDLNQQQFDVNALGEVVYMAKDTNDLFQIYSSVRGQVTSDLANHYFPCINDSGEIIWTEFVSYIGAVITSTTRGVLSTGAGMVAIDLNNSGELCLMGSLEYPPGYHTYPHIFSSTHGVLIDDAQQYQYSGALNDEGTFVWSDYIAPALMGVYKADWITLDETPPQINGVKATPANLWPPNNRMVAVDFTVDITDNIDPSPTARIIQVSAADPYASSSDWQITGPLAVSLRATQLPKGDQRVYTVSIEGRDASGNTTTNAMQIKVTPERKPSR